MPFGKSRRQAASSLTRKKILSVFASTLRKAGFTAEDQCGEAASQSDYLAQRRQGRKVWRLRVKIICKSFHLSLLNLATLRLGGRNFRLRLLSARPTSDRHDPRALLFPCLIIEIKLCDNRRMIAGADLSIGGAPGGFSRQGSARQDVIDAPTDISLAQLAPGRPPGEKIIVVRVKRSADVNQPSCQDALEDFSFLRSLAHHGGVPLFGVHVAFAARDIDV